MLVFQNWSLIKKWIGREERKKDLKCMFIHFGESCGKYVHQIAAHLFSFYIYCALLCTLTGRGSSRGKLPFKCGTNKSEKRLNQQQRNVYS
jgi:hypothetical protein